MVRNYRRRNPELELTELWHRLRKKGYTRRLESLYRVMKKLGLLPGKPKPPKHKPEPYEQMKRPGERVQIDVKVVLRKCIADPGNEAVSIYGNRRVYAYALPVWLMNVIIAVNQFRLAPCKTNPMLIYAFKNDDNINYLTEQLRTIGEFNFSSKEQMYAKADGLKKANDTRQLKSDTDLIRAYESIVEGIYIDNLIRDIEKK